MMAAVGVADVGLNVHDITTFVVKLLSVTDP